MIRYASAFHEAALCQAGIQQTSTTTTTTAPPVRAAVTSTTTPNLEYPYERGDDGGTEGERRRTVPSTITLDCSSMTSTYCVAEA